MVDFAQAIDEAKNLASARLGYNVQKRIWNRPTSAGGQLNFIFGIVRNLCELFEKQKEYLTSIELMERYQEIVRCALDGDEANEMDGLQRGLEQYARHQEFRKDRDPEKREAAFTWLFELFTILHNRVQTVTIEEYMDLPIDRSFHDGKYFDRDYVFGKLRDFCREQITASL